MSSRAGPDWKASAAATTASATAWALRPAEAASTAATPLSAKNASHSWASVTPSV
jgi:hypothetical protein